MRGAILALLLFAGSGRGRLGRSMMDLPMERMLLDLAVPVAGNVLLLGAVGLPTRSKDTRELALFGGRERRGLMVSFGLELYFQ